MRALFLCVLLVGCANELDETQPIVDSGNDTGYYPDTRTPTPETGSTVDTGTAVDSAAVDSTTVDSTTTDSATVDSTTTDSAPDTSLPPFDSGSGCNTVVQKGSPITQGTWTDPIPTWTGGTISDGTYVMTKWAATAGGTPSPIPVSETLVISGGTMQMVANAGTTEIRQNGAVSASGSTLTYTPTCPVSKANSSSYNATATDFTAYAAEGGAISVFTKL